MRKIKDKTKQRAYFLTTQSGVPRVIKRKKFSIKRTDHVKFKDQFFPIDSTKPTFKIKNKEYFLIDVSGKGQLLMEEILGAFKIGEIDEENKDPFMIPTGQLYLDTIFEDLTEAYTVLGEIALKYTIKNLLDASELKKNWKELIMGAIIGALGTGFIMMILMQEGVF